MRLGYVVCFSIFFMILQGQNLRSISFFDEKGKLSNEEMALYYRENPDSSNFYKSFYSKNKSKYFEGIIINASDSLDNKNLFQGLCKWYYPNGNLKLFAEYSYSGILHGIKKEFNNEGKLIKSSIYENGKLKNNVYFEFDEKGSSVKVFEEKFSDNIKSWPIENQLETSSKFRIGGYELVNKSKKNYVVFCEKNIDSVNFSIETLINSNYLTPDTKCGIVFGFKDKNNFSYFNVSKYRISGGFIKDGINKNYFDDFFSYELNGNNLNKIRVQVFKDSLYFFVNDKIQAISLNLNVYAQSVGLFVNNGSILFDDFYIKEYNRNSLILDKGRRMFYNVNQNLLPVNQINSGLILGKNGYILTSIKNIHQVNCFLISLMINDSVKNFEADVFYNSDIYDFTILKLRNYASQYDFNIEYNYNYLKNLTSSVNSIVFEYEHSEFNSNFEFVKIRAEGKTISKHGHSYVGVYNTHNCLGAPVFDLDGNVLGVISDVDKLNSFKIIPIQQVLGVLFSKPETNDIKNRVDFSVSDFNNNIKKNIVVVKTF
jgi:hypothetical protein